MAFTIYINYFPTDMRRYLYFLLVLAMLPPAARGQYRPGGIDPVVWLDASTGVTVVGGGDNNVITWADQSGNARNATGANPNQPDLTTAGMGTGLPSILFTAANADRLSFANSALINNLAISQRLLTLAFKPNGVTNRQVLYEHGSSTSGMSLYILSGTLYAGVWWGTAAAQRAFTSLPITNATNHVASVSVNSTGNVVLYLDGTASTGVAAAATVANNNVASLGAVNGTIRYHDGTSPTNSGAAPFNGDIAEMVLLNDASNIRRIMIENYLAQKYNVSLGANDRFVPSPSVYAQMVGVGQTSATDLITTTTRSSNGLYLANPTTLPFIQDNDDYILTANNAATGFTSVGVAGRYLNRTWTVDVTNSGAGFDNFITLKFDVVEEGNNMPIYTTVSDYYLRIEGIPTHTGEAFIENGTRICFTISAMEMDGKRISLGTNFGASYTPYQPGGADRCIAWWDASNPLPKITGTVPISLWDDASSNSANNFDGIPPGTVTPGVAPNLTSGYFGSSLHGVSFAAASQQFLRVNNVTSGTNSLTGLTYNNKMIIAYFNPNNVVGGSGFQVLFEQGDSLHGLNMYADLTAKNFYIGAWRNKGTDFNLFLSNPLTLDNATNYLVTSVFDRAGTARFRYFQNGNLVNQTAITGILPMLPHNSTARDNVGIGAIRAGTRFHTDAAGTDVLNTGRFFDGVLGELIEYNDNSNALRRIVESYLAKKFNRTIAGNVYSGANGFEPIGIGRETATDAITATDLPSGGLLLTNVSFLNDPGDYLMTANNNVSGKNLYGVNGFTWMRHWDVTVTDAAPTAGGNVTLSFNIDREGSDRTLYSLAQYFLYDVTAAAPIAGTLGTATSSGTAPNRMVSITVSVSAIAGKRITLGVANATMPVECNCFDGLDGDSDGVADASDSDCTTKWRCDGSFMFSEFTAGGAADYTRFRTMAPAYTPFALDNYATSNVLQKFDATAYYRNDSLVYGIVSEGAGINKLYRIQRDGTSIDMGIPIGNTGITFPAGASNFRAAAAMVRTTTSPAASVAKLVFANNAVNATSGAAKRIAILDINAFAQPRVITYNALVFTDAAGTPDFTDLELDPTITSPTAQAYAYDRGRKLLIRVTVAGPTANIGQCTAVSGATAQPYDNVDALFFDEFGELYGYATPTGGAGANTLVYINKTNGNITAISANGLTAPTLDGCGCAMGVGMRVTPVDAGNIAITSAPANSTIRYRVDIINRSQTNLSGLSFAETFSDSRTFTAISYITVFSPTPTVSGLATGSISITNISVAANSTASFVLDVFVPTELANTTVTTQPVAANLPVTFGSTRVSDYTVTTTALRDATPLNIVNPLPVEWASIDAYRVEDYTQIEWATFTEVNNAYFTVERSADRIFWEEIAQVSAVGNSQSVQSYTARDYSPMMGINYYQIKQVDVDGQFSYSETVKVQFKEENPLSLRIYPNPTSTAADPTVSFFATQAQVYELHLSDLRGEVLTARTVNAVYGRNQLTLPLGDLPQGVYFIQLSSEDVTATEKLIIYR